MAISPTVNAYMQQDQGGAPQDADQMFVQQFTTQAYNSLRAKYSALLNHIVTFKMLSSDIDEGTAFGAFVIRYGSDVRYVPVVMAGGAIVSCEMIYDKGEDAFSPLLDSVVKDIVEANSYSDPTILANNPRVDDTRGLFRQMMRPPASSNVVLASGRVGVRDLPNECKKAVSDYLENDAPELLGKIAQFYDIEELAWKLSPVQEMPKVAEAVLPDFLRLDTLTKAAAELLDDAGRQDMLDRGYVVLDHDKSAAVVLEKGASELETELRLTTWPNIDDTHTGRGHRGIGDTYPVMRGNLACATASGLSFEPVLLAGPELITRSTYTSLGSDSSRTALISELDESVPEDYYGRFPNIVPASSVLSKINARPKDSYVHLHFLIPMGSGRIFMDGDFVCDGRPDDWSMVEKDGERVLFAATKRFGDTPTVRISRALKRGYIMHGSSIIVPEDTLFVLSKDGDDDPVRLVDSFDTLRKLLYGLGSHVKVAHDGVAWNIIDRRMNKSASLASRVDAAEFLHSAYGLSANDIERLLDNGGGHVFEKSAFGEEQQVPPEMAQAQQYPQGMQEQAAPQPMGQQAGATSQQGFDPSTVANAAAVGDPDTLDAGILASFAQYPDIKQLLVDYLPDFASAQDRLGRVLLLFSYQKKDLEEFYGQEKYGSIMGACRRIFTVIGELTESLKMYANMAKQ